MILFELLSAIEKGKELKDAATWSNRVALGSVVTTLLAAGVGVARYAGFDLPLTDAELLEVSAASTIILGSANALFSVATHRGSGV